MSQRLSRPQPEEQSYRYVGRSVPRTDAAAKVTGEAAYVMDFQPGNLLHAKLIPSGRAHATLVSVDTSAAEALDGVEAVLTCDDAPDTRRGRYILDQPIFATEKVRYLGEPIGIVVAETPEIAEAAVDLVEVAYEPLPGVFDLDEAFAREPPAAVHDDVRGYQVAGAGGDPRHQGVVHVADVDADRPNLLYKIEDERGDVQDGFRQADRIVEATYETRAFQNCSMEPHVAVAHRRGGEVTVWTSHQTPHHVRKELLESFPNLGQRQLRVRTACVGGGFGNKDTAFAEPRVVAAAMHVDRPVRLAFSRAEEFLLGRPQVRTVVRDGVTDDGDLVARDARMTLNAGAYNEEAIKMLRGLQNAVFGSYAVPNVRWRCDAVYTNLPPAGAFRGFGKPEVNWAMERHMNRVAQELGTDPLEYRARNLLREGDVNAVGETLGPGDTEECLRQPVERLRKVDIAADYPGYDPDRWAFGLGFAFGSKPVSRRATAITVQVRKGPSVEVRTGAPDIGQGSDTLLTQIAAEEFGIDIGAVEIVAGDTGTTPFDQGPTGSRHAYHTGNALRKAAAEVKQKLFELAAQRFDVPVDPGDLDSADGDVFVRGDPERWVRINDLFSTYTEQDTMLDDGGELIGTATFDSREAGEHHAFWTPTGQAALVAVDRLTGRTEVLRFVSACDVGRAINPKTVEQQLEGGAAQGIASALYEEVVYADGQMTNPNFKDYRIPTAAELPHDSGTILIESHDEVGPYGARGVGEMGMMAAAPAVGNAVVDALGVDFDVIPITPERVLAGLDGA